MAADTPAPLRPPDRSRQAAQPRAHRRPRPGRRAVDAQGRRVHGRRPRPADRRRGDVVDRDDALQPQPAAAGGVREGGHPGRRRHADGVQHHRGLRRRVDGHRGHEGLADQPRGHRGLDRARRARPPVRRHRVPRRLRQDDPGRGDGRSGRLGIPGLVLYNGTIYPGTYKGQPADIVSVYEAIGAYRAGQDQPRGAVRGRERRLPRRRRVRRPVHGQHDGDGAASSWACRPRASTGSRPRTRPRTTPRAGPASS